MKVTIDCPICSSKNHFDAESLKNETVCEDCGFELSKNGYLTSDNFACCFCGGVKFYKESAFGLPFGYRIICYVCNASYKHLEIKGVDEQFFDKSFDEEQKAFNAARWRQRIADY